MSYLPLSFLLDTTFHVHEIGHVKELLEMERLPQAPLPQACLPQALVELLLGSRGSQGERLLTNEMVGDAYIENPEMVLNSIEDRQVSQRPMAPSPSQTPRSPPPLMEYLQFVVPTMLVFLTIRHEAKPEAFFGKHQMPLWCFIATTNIYWLTAAVMKEMALTTKARERCYPVLSRIALVSGIQSALFLLSMFMNHVPPTIIYLLISVPIALLIAYLFIKMLFGAGERNSTDQPVRSEA